MALSTLKNQFRGLNPLLHSAWLAEGTWSVFHSLHLGDICKMLQAQARPLGYQVDMERGIQIRREEESPYPYRPDLSILRGEAAPPVYAGVAEAIITAPALHPLELLYETPPDEAFYPAVTIYRLEAGGKRGVQPVAWLELLSPSNKTGAALFHYVKKREAVLNAGIVFIELDYIHTLPPTLPRRADYSDPRQAETAFPYSIAIVDPRPTLAEGRAYLREFRVDEPLPTMDIPLMGADVLVVDFGAAYAKSFREAFWGDRVDYGQTPAHLNHYSAADQACIMERLALVRSAAQAGADLEA